MNYGKTKSTLYAAAVVSVILALTSCTSEEREREETPTGVSAPTTVAAEPVDRLRNRWVALTDVQGRPLSVLPEGQTRSRLDALATPTLIEGVYTPTECVPETAFTPPPESLDVVLGRSHISEDRSRLMVEIYTASGEAELIDYFIGADPDAPLECTDYTVETNGISQHFSYDGVDIPPIAPSSRSAQYSVTQDEATMHRLNVVAVNGMVAATVTLSTADPADPASIDAVLNIAQQATN
jgi:hypothetical protein